MDEQQKRLFHPCEWLRVDYEKKLENVKMFNYIYLVVSKFNMHGCPLSYSQGKFSSLTRPWCIDLLKL